jgi:hypothetical protein
MRHGIRRDNVGETQPLLAARKGRSMPEPRRTRHRASLVAGLALVTAVTASACGGSVEVPTPSGSRTVQLPSVSVSVPSISVPSVPTPSISLPTEGESPGTTAPPETTAPPDPTPTVTQTETETETTEPTPAPTETVTETAEPTPEPAETETPSPTPSPTETDLAAPAAEEDDGGIPEWVWWLAAALALAAAVVLVVRARRRAAWDDDLTAAEAEVTWLARDLLPRMRATGSREAAAGAWAVSHDRVQALEDRLTWLEATAASEPRRLRAQVLRDAVREARTRSTALGHPGPSAGFAAEVDAVVAALEGALAPPPGR